MIILDVGDADTSGGEEIKVSFPLYSVTDQAGKKHTPCMVFARPTTASIRAAESAAIQALPSRNEDEKDDAFEKRAIAELEKLGFANLLAKSGLRAAISGASQELAITHLAIVHLIRWEGFGNAAGEPIEPDPGAIAQAMKDEYTAKRVEKRLYRRHHQVAEEGNG